MQEHDIKPLILAVGKNDIGYIASHSSEIFELGIEYLRGLAKIVNPTGIVSDPIPGTAITRAPTERPRPALSSNPAFKYGVYAATNGKEYPYDRFGKIKVGEKRYTVEGLEKMIQTGQNAYPNLKDHLKNNDRTPVKSVTRTVENTHIEGACPRCGEKGTFIIDHYEDGKNYAAYRHKKRVHYLTAVLKAKGMTNDQYIAQIKAGLIVGSASAQQPTGAVAINELHPHYIASNLS